jgi:phosphohistidine phosphatase SixA
MRLLTCLLAGSFVVVPLLSAGQGAAQNAPDVNVGAALKAGGAVIVMRHASSPRTLPTTATANPDNPGLERQLDAAGREGARAMGDALRLLGIPVNQVLTSPAYRARETVRTAGLQPVDVLDVLGDGGQSMQGVTEAQGAWLRSRVTQAPPSGSVLVVTHQPNLARAFPEWGGALAEGESVVFKPDGRGGAVMVVRIPIEEWPRLTASAPSTTATGTRSAPPR